MRTTLDLPDVLFRELKSQAALRGMKMKDLLRELIEHSLRTSDSKQRKRSPLPVARRSVRRAIPALGNTELHQLLDAEDAKHYAQPKA